MWKEKPTLLHIPHEQCYSVPENFNKPQRHSPAFFMRGHGAETQIGCDISSGSGEWTGLYTYSYNDTGPNGAEKWCTDILNWWIRSTEIQAERRAVQDNSRASERRREVWVEAESEQPELEHDQNDELNREQPGIFFYSNEAGGTNEVEHYERIWGEEQCDVFLYQQTSGHVNKLW